MQGISRVNYDYMQGFPSAKLIVPPTQTFCLVEGYPIAQLSQKVIDHDITHINVTMVQASNITKVNGIGVVRNNDLASCGHQATGSNLVYSD